MPVRPPEGLASGRQVPRERPVIGAMHSDKERDMARSLLPSRWRGAARAKAQAKRSTRREVSRVMSELSVDPDAWDDADGVFDDSAIEVRGVVNRRRSSDKVNPFIRWATQTTKHLPKPSRLHHLRGVLPKGLIGDHALTHLAREESFDLRLSRPRYRRRLLLDRGHLATVLRRVLEVRGGHALVNEVLTRQAIVDERTQQPLTRASVRRLLGVHDVLPFLEDLDRPPYRSLRYVLDALCRTLWRCHFDLERTVLELPSPVGVPAWSDFTW